MSSVSQQRGKASLRQLLSEGMPRTFPPVLQSADAKEISQALLQAVHFKKNLTLLDPALGPELLKTLEVDPQTVNQTISLEADPVPQSLEGWVAKLKTSSNGKLRLLSSGTTGKPTWSNHSIPSLTRSVRRGRGLAEAIWGLCYPPSHMGGIQVLLQALFSGAAFVDLNDLEDTVLVDLLESVPVTHLSATPMFYQKLTQSGNVFRNVRQVTFGGDRYDAEVFQQLPQTFPNARFKNIYALTETGPLLVSDSDVFTIGPKQKDWVQIRQEALWVRPPGDVEGNWIPTGDQVEVVRKDPQQFRFSGRSQEVVNVAGMKVFLPEVESALQSHPQVREARVFAKSNPVSGKLLWAEVVVKDPAPAEGELREFLRKKLPPAAIPRMIQFVDAVTRTSSGKLQR